MMKRETRWGTGNMWGGSLARRGRVIMALLIPIAGGCGGESPEELQGEQLEEDSAELTASSCQAGTSSGAVRAPTFLRNFGGETSWFASPVVADLDKNGSQEIVASMSSTQVFNSQGQLLSSGTTGSGRVWAPPVVADLDADGVTEVVAGRGKNVIAWEWRNRALQLKSGWPRDTTTAGQSPEVSGLAAGDLNLDGRIEVVATTTQRAATSSGGAQVFTYSANGQNYQPAACPWKAWPRYNALRGTGNDADRNGAGHQGYAAYGLNVGIGQVDSDAPLEIAATYDNHFLQIFNHDGAAANASPYFTNRTSAYFGQRLTWGQMIRFPSASVEAAQYNTHTGPWAGPSWTEWLQWTRSPPSIVDIDRDGKAEVIGVANVEKGEPYVTQAWTLTAFQGGHDGGSNAAKRKPGWEVFPRGGAPIRVSGYYPPMGIPSVAFANLSGDSKLEMVVGLNDGYVYAFNASAQRLWRVDIRHGRSIMFSSEPVIADLNQDGVPEVVVATYGAPNSPGAGRLMVLSASGAVLQDVALPNQKNNGNATGAAGAPTIADVDNNGTLEILVQTFDHGIDMFTVPGSGKKCLPWPTARGSALRQGRP